MGVFLSGGYGRLFSSSSTSRRTATGRRGELRYVDAMAALARVHEQVVAQSSPSPADMSGTRRLSLTP